MRGLLIVLCSIVTAAAALAGGCGLLVTTLLAGAAQKREDVAGLLLIAMPVLAVTGAVALVNLALITAIANGRAPRRTLWFLLLAVVDFVLAGILVAAGFAGQGPVNPGDASTLLLPVMLALKGGITLLLPAEPPRMPPPQ
jgi:ABC-type multidrug transport system permease subunit